MDNIPRNNFDNLMWSLTTIFQFLSGENWNSIMYDCYRAAGVGGIIYSLAIFILGVMIVMNLFLAILLSNFEGNDDLINVDTEAVTASTRELMASMPKADPGTPMNRRPTVMPDSNAKAFWILSQGNLLRAACTRIALDKRFENFILFLIIFSSITLAIDNPLDETNAVLQVLDVIMSMMFFLEFVIKAISLGFALHKGSYMRNSWNVLDFVIVVISFMALAGVGPGKSLRALRTVRVLRPLRMVNKVRWCEERAQDEGGVQGVQDE